MGGVSAPRSRSARHHARQAATGPASRVCWSLRAVKRRKKRAAAALTWKPQPRSQTPSLEWCESFSSDESPFGRRQHVEEQRLKIKSEKDFWSGLMFIVIGAAFAWGATNYSFGSSARPGPAYFPFGLGVLMALLGGLILFKALTFEVQGGDKIGPWAWKPLGMITATVAIFGWSLPHLGMVVALPILVVVAALAGDEFHWKDALINSIILTIGSWFIFIWGLNLTLPLWPSFLIK